MMKKYLAAGAAIALGLGGASASQAAVFTPADCVPGNIHFCVTGDAEAPGVDDVITGFITNTFSAATSIDDTFLFAIDKNGVGSGGLQTSFSSASTLLTITDLIINGVSYASSIMGGSAGQSVNVNGIPIVSGEVNTVRILGSFTPPAGGGQANYTGNLTFNATAVPEMATWAMMILGMGAIGFTMRRRNQRPTSTSLSYA